jgi:hypothetical protein
VVGGTTPSTRHAVRLVGIGGGDTTSSSQHLHVARPGHLHGMVLAVVIHHAVFNHRGQSSHQSDHGLVNVGSFLIPDPDCEGVEMIGLLSLGTFVGNRHPCHDAADSS